MPRAGFASLIGRPNAGKSTLLNRIVGTKVAIVSDKPQTTRNRIVAVKNLPEGQIVFVDTPGIHRPLHRLNVRMVDAAVETLREVDVVALIFDASTRPGHGDEYVSNLIKDVKVPVVLVLNKIDLIAKAKLLPLIERARQWHEFAAIVPVSAVTADGIGQLEQVLLENLPESEPIYPEDFLTDQAERTLVAEMVREKVLHHTRNELPFSTAVIVDQFDESERDPSTRSARSGQGLLRLYCTIYVETESQKPIVIGRGGDMIKRIGTEARKEMESFFDTKVFLDLRVKVDPDWRNNERTLDEIGVPRTARKPRKR
ncbi:MAG TPA: GTPase Era [Vicinamibacterales bacterium]|jgi:GTP-binding protein Era|nr:GTPase Era [Vicinamibacterales bacterium]